MPENLADSIPKDSLSSLSLLTDFPFYSHLNIHNVNQYRFFSKWEGVGG